MRSDALRRRETILRVTRELFAQHGAQIAMETIAEASDVGIGTLYRNFADRTELIEEVTLRMLNDIQQTAESAATRLRAGENEAWDELIDQLVQQNLGALSEGLGTQIPEQLSAQILDAQKRAGRSLNDALDLAKSVNLVRDDLTIIELIATIGAMTRPLSRTFSKNRPGVQERIVEIMRDGLRTQTTQE